MIEKKLLAAAFVVAALAIGCGDNSNQSDNGNPADVAGDNGSDTIGNDGVEPEDTTVRDNQVTDTMPEDKVDPTDVPVDAMPACPPHKCVDDGTGNLVENPNAGCVGEFCAASATADPDPTAFGPYPVGIRRFMYEDPNTDNKNEDGTPRMLKIEVWFPTTEEFRDGTDYIYDIKEDCNDAVKEKYADVNIGQFPVDAVMDAPVRHGEGRYPLVIFSHGAYGIRFQSMFFTAQLASHGYVVVAADHQYNTLNEILTVGWNGADLIPAAMHRPKDIFALLNWIEAKTNNPDDEFYDLVDMENVACTGHSFGGLTSYVVTVDPRIDAIVPMSPAADMAGAFENIFGNTPIDKLSIPTMVMGGKMDKTLQYQSQQRDWFDIQPPPKWMLTIPRGGHYTFTDICRMNLVELEAYWGDAEDALEDGCGENNWDWTLAHKAVNLYAIAFLNHFLRHDPAAADRLVPAAGAEFGTEIEFTAVPE